MSHLCVFSSASAMVSGRSSGGNDNPGGDHLQLPVLISFL